VYHDVHLLSADVVWDDHHLLPRPGGNLDDVLSDRRLNPGLLPAHLLSADVVWDDHHLLPAECKTLDEGTLLRPLLSAVIACQNDYVWVSRARERTGSAPKDSHITSQVNSPLWDQLTSR